MGMQNWTAHWLSKLSSTVKARGFSPKTGQNYAHCLEVFLQRFAKHPAQIDPESIQKHLVHLLETGKLAEATVNLHREALRFFYKEVLKIADPLSKIPRLKTPHKLPKVLSSMEVYKLITGTANPKHRLILAVAYAGGLRLAELVNLNHEDIDFDRNLIHIRRGKGGKDRIVMLSQAMREELTAYLKIARPNRRLFESTRGQALCPRTVQAVFNQACIRVGIQGKVGIHALRHSFATHLLEDGTDLRYIQALLGHESSKTTEIYAHVAAHHVSKIVSPYDRLKVVGNL